LELKEKKKYIKERLNNYEKNSKIKPFSQNVSLTSLSTILLNMHKSFPDSKEQVINRKVEINGKFKTIK